jgi:DUF971 family protein
VIAPDDHRFPLSIVDHQVTGVLELGWQDGAISRLPHGLLRSLCRCAGCEQQFRTQGRRPDVSPDVRLDDIRPIGDKALNLQFTDGHGRGIYPWAYLRQIAREHSGLPEAPVPSATANPAQPAHA